MYRVAVTTPQADAWGTLPDAHFTLPERWDTMPTYNEVRDCLISLGIKSRIRSITVRHIFMGRTVARLDNEVGEIVEVF